MEQIEFTDNYKTILFSIPLFRDLPGTVKPELLDKLDHRLFSFEKNDIIARQNMPCRTLYVILQGKLKVDIIDVSGNEVIIEDIIAPRAFATPHLFSKDNTLPATFTAVEKGILFTATKESLFKLISEEPMLLRSFLSVTGNCNRCTVTRLHALQLKGIRSRIISYLFDQPEDGENAVTMAHTQAQLADYLCVTRPALSKELNKMEKEGLIIMEKRKIIIPDKNILKRQMM